MKTRLIIEGNAVYEIDEECEACMRKAQGAARSNGKKSPADRDKAAKGQTHGRS